MGVILFMNNECNCEKDSNGTLKCPVHYVPEIPEQEQKIYDSEPLTSDEIGSIQGNLFGDDITGGLHNIQVPLEELEKIKEQEELAKEHIIVSDESTQVSPQTSDGIICVFTPEELMILKNIIEEQSIEMTDIGYMSTIMEECELYDQQTYIRGLRDKVDMNINRYVKLRPYSPWSSSWIKKIGKKHVRTV